MCTLQDAAIEGRSLHPLKLGLEFTPDVSQTSFKLDSKCDGRTNLDPQLHGGAKGAASIDESGRNNDKMLGLDSGASEHADDGLVFVG